MANSRDDGPRADLDFYVKTYTQIDGEGRIWEYSPEGVTVYERHRDGSMTVLKVPQKA